MLGIDLELADHGLPDDLHIVATHAARGLSQLVLRTDIAGMPLEWIDYKEAARLYHQEQVAYTCGSLLYELYGGTNARTSAARACGCMKPTTTAAARSCPICSSVRGCTVSSTSALVSTSAAEPAQETLL